MGGLNPVDEEPGFKRVILRPVPDFAARSAAAEYHSASGTYRTEWKVIDPNHVYFRAEIPFGCTAQLVLPYAKPQDAVRELETGVFEITYELTEPLKKSFSCDIPVGEILEDPNAFRILKTFAPQISSLPPHMYGLSIRRIAGQFAPGGEMNPMMDMLDQKFAEL